MATYLNGKRVAILVTDGFEQVEMTGPKDALEQAGVQVDILGRGRHRQRLNHDKPADDFPVTNTFQAVSIDQYDAVLLPGGVQNSDTIRIDQDAQHLVKTAASAGKPIAVICHGSWLLISAGLVNGKTMTSYKTVKDDLVNAGVNWVDQEVVKDGNLISSRQPDDVPAFSQALIDALAA